MALSAPFRFDRSWQFDVPLPRLWTVLLATDEFPNWWTWLESFDAPDGLAPGALANAVIRAPLPYVLRLQIQVDRVVPERSVDTTVSGDLTGVAQLRTSPAGDRSEARLTWDLALTNGMLRAAAVLGRPLMSWAHDRVVATGVEQFRQRALE